MFAFPGIWRRYKGPIRKIGETIELDVYAFLTTTPNPLVATINHERMPELTKPEEFDQWLNGPTAEALELAREYPSAVHVRARAAPLDTAQGAAGAKRRSAIDG